MRRNILLFMFFVGISFAVTAQDVRGSKDHKSISRYPKSEIRYYYQKNNSVLKLPQGVKESKPSNILRVKGRHTSILYAAPKDIKPSQILKKYTETIKKLKGEVLFSCEGKFAPNGCDDYETYSSLSFFNANYYKSRYNRTSQYILLNGSDDQAFMVASFEEGGKKVYVEVGIDGNSWKGQAGVQVEIIEQEKAEGNSEKSQFFEKEMERTGKIALYKILFETGKSNLKEELQEEINLVADYLRKFPKMNIYIVGHTDDSGILSLNVNLSKQRAKAVKDYLLNLGISDKRIVTEGVGPFAPVSTNTTDEGRKQNRRVEIVKRQG